MRLAPTTLIGVSGSRSSPKIADTTAGIRWGNSTSRWKVCTTMSPVNAAVPGMAATGPYSNWRTKETPIVPVVRISGSASPGTATGRSTWRTSTVTGRVPPSRSTSNRVGPDEPWTATMTSA